MVVLHNPCFQFIRLYILDRPVDSDGTQTRKSFGLFKQKLHLSFVQRLRFPIVVLHRFALGIVDATKTPHLKRKGTKLDNHFIYYT